MTYTLWSRNRLLGSTALDLEHVQPHVRLGFIDPTGEGLRLLPEATGVPTAAHALARAAKRAAYGRCEGLTEYADFRAACDRREALDLELRDQTGVVFPCEWIEVHDIDALPFIDEELGWEDDEPMCPEVEAAIEHDADTIGSFSDGYDQTWEPPDDRWAMSRYHIMVYLRAEP